jgi:hypothetical protein
MNPLIQLKNNEPLVNALKSFFQSELDKTILKRAYKGDDVKDIAEAKKVIDKAFNDLEVMFKDNAKRNVQNAK